jgi:hypothetical protein
MGPIRRTAVETHRYNSETHDYISEPAARVP